MKPNAWLRASIRQGAKMATKIQTAIGIEPPMAPQTQSIPVWMRPADAAIYLNLSQPLLAKLRCYGGGPVFSKIGKAVLYYRDELDKWIAARARTSTSDDGSETKKLAS
jgi:hypothetical protein